MSSALLSDVPRLDIPMTLHHMLGALLSEDGPSRRSLEKWAVTVDLDNVDPASYRLIPAVYARAQGQPEIARHSGRMKGIYRNFFYRNNRFLAAVQQVFKALVAEGVDFIVFKGTALVLQHHSSAALRSFHDCDILIHQRDKHRAEALLQRIGYSYSLAPEIRRLVKHSADFKDAAGHGIDLHWYATHESCYEDADEGFWQRSRRIVWNGLEVRVLSAEDELLVAGLNGLRERSLDRVDWLYDAATIFSSQPGPDLVVLRKELLRRRLHVRFMPAFALMSDFIPAFPRAEVERIFDAEIRSAASRARAEKELHRLLSVALDDGGRFSVRPEIVMSLVKPAVAARRLLYGTASRARSTASQLLRFDRGRP